MLVRTTCRSILFRYKIVGQKQELHGLRGRSDSHEVGPYQSTADGDWRGLLDWMRDKLVGEGMIAAGDLDLMRVIEEPEAIVEAIFDYYENRGFQPTRVERDKMLNL
jgi:predicted Rossmann-fold nucleotide-binding protein